MLVLLWVSTPPPHLLHGPFCNVPVGTDIGVVGNLVVVHSPVTLIHEPFLLAIGSDARGSSDGFLEVSVDG